MSELAYGVSAVRKQLVSVTEAWTGVTGPHMPNGVDVKSQQFVPRMMSDNDTSVLTCSSLPIVSHRGAFNPQYRHDVRGMYDLRPYRSGGITSEMSSVVQRLQTANMMTYVRSGGMAQLRGGAPSSLPVSERIGPVKSRSATSLRHSTAPYPTIPQQYMMNKRSQQSSTQALSVNVMQATSTRVPNRLVLAANTERLRDGGGGQVSVMSNVVGTQPLQLQRSLSMSAVPPAASTLPCVGDRLSFSPPATTWAPSAACSMKPSSLPCTPAVSNMSSMSSFDGSLRMMLPLRDGVLLPSFQLPHHLPSCTYTFHVKDVVYQQLVARRDFDLELRCFMPDDYQTVDWPSVLTVSINSVPLQTEQHRPLAIKRFCRPGANTLNITVSGCCCSHRFVVQLVSCPSLLAIVRGLINRRLLPAEHGVSKIRRLLLPGIAPSRSATTGEHCVSVVVSLFCPLSHRRISLPARGHDCRHVQCFDLESYLMFNVERNYWLCPICRSLSVLEYLEVDQYMWGILSDPATALCSRVTLDVTVDRIMASFTSDSHPPPLRPPIGLSDGPCCKPMNASNMLLPTTSSWSSTASTSNSSSATRCSSTTPLSDPTSPESIVPYSPLSCVSDYAVAASPRLPPSTPDTLPVSASPITSQPTTVTHNFTAPTTPRPLSSSAMPTELTTSASSLASTGVKQNVVTASNDSAVTTSCTMDVTPTAAPRPLLSGAVEFVNFTSGCMFVSEDQRKQVIDDILADTIPDLSELLPPPDTGDAVNRATSAPMSDDDLLSLFV